MSRIIAGIAGGLALTSVPGTGTRPTTDRVKESVFSRLEHWEAIQDARVLDLFAGSGALGLEAVSRGARRAVLVDSADAAVRTARANAERVNKAVGAGQRGGRGSAGPAQTERGTTGARAVKGRAPGIIGTLGDVWDLVFLDPPYPVTEEELAEVLESLLPRLSESAVVVVERSSRSPEPAWPAGLEMIDGKKYGETRIWYAEPANRG
ncbi:16S rRNA (guanine(966)-N(2))-methyltransferase RsmD [Zhihengliuella sp.]|uniref:16S rRNA (guanine(966)-N(2))-methyltransferase RsmD n=1 Tax=Zhihengliuella sp. TaxID=1954483 RepID=UPI0028124D20|nr:16S rRNA (guanine(966)-N(2))-methyltransferase RsmD [Zhihengliuella sp.]